MFEAWQLYGRGLQTALLTYYSKFTTYGVNRALLYAKTLEMLRFMLYYNHTIFYVFCFYSVVYYNLYYPKNIVFFRIRLLYIPCSVCYVVL